MSKITIDMEKDELYSYIKHSPLQGELKKELRALMKLQLREIIGTYFEKNEFEVMRELRIATKEVIREFKIKDIKDIEKMLNAKVEVIK